MKRCATCHETKPLDEFNMRRASGDGRQPRCRQCSCDFYAQNSERLRAAVDGRIGRVRAGNQRRLADYLAMHPCVDCGQDDLRVLDFDHNEGVSKRANIARMLASLSWTVIEAEIAKCDVRCANCHRRRTCERAGWWRQAVFEQTSTARSRDSAQRLGVLFPGVV